ncbi:MAG TPA: molybdopterin-dependent oxidoreductase [Terriglobales bacterium]|nr:molybdopterin-dependent oxidoreductase [Terriglobales bacterium]
MISRRDFLKDTALTLAAAGTIQPLLSWATDPSAPIVPGKQGMILRSFRFLDLEMPPEFMSNWITPVPHFFVRNHMFEPSALNAGEWRLNISGEVDKPLTLSLAELEKIESHSVTNTLECAGNGRAFQNPHVPGIQWQRGAVGNARFTGPRLRDLLERAGVKPTGKQVMFHGLDEVPGKVPPFIRSIPLEKAVDGDTLIAIHMNGAPLNKHHGFPARALVPGWIGAASCKWLSEIKVIEKEFEGNFMKPGYRMPDKPVEPGGSVNPDETHPITTLNVKSVIASPRDRTPLKQGAIEIHGAAWAGEADVTKLEVSTDSGATWNPARLGSEHAHYAWRLWNYSWKPAKSGEFVIMSRASDSKGRQQPATASWNPSGYLYNAVDQVKVHVQV